MTVLIEGSLRLPESEHFPGTQQKSGIAIHHTVGGSARSTFRWWCADKTDDGRNALVGTAYIIDHDGTQGEREWLRQTGWGLSWR
jgi:hypothetical protein